MAIPDYQTIMLPFLKFAVDGKEHSKREAFDKLANFFNLSESELRELLPSGKQELFDNRLGWTSTHLKKAGLITSTRRGYFCITERGRELLKQNPSKIDVKLLKQYPEFREFISYKGEKVEPLIPKEDELATP
jgi:restriction system protein